MVFWEYILLAVIQGVAEFLPISSSGHLALLGDFFDLSVEDSGLLSVMLHAGSLLAIVVYYFRELLNFYIIFYTFFHFFAVAEIKEISVDGYQNPFLILLKGVKQFFRDFILHLLPRFQTEGDVVLVHLSSEHRHC